MCMARQNKSGWQCIMCVSSYNGVMGKKKKARSLAETAAGNSSPLCQAAGACGLSNTPANS